MKRIAAIFLLAALICGLAVPAAAEDLVDPLFQKIIMTSAELTIDEKTSVATCYAMCSADSDVTIKIVGTLQQYSNKAWVHVTSWTATGTRNVTMKEQYTVQSGYKYRFIARFYIYNTNGSFVESDMKSSIYDFT